MLVSIFPQGNHKGAIDKSTCGEGTCSRLSAQHSQSSMILKTLGPLRSPTGASSLATEKL